MERYIGIVTAVSGQRAKVRIERGLKKGEKPRILDCWNTCEAKKGTYVEVEEQTLGERQGKWIVRGIPLLTLLAGAIFGRAVSRYLNSLIASQSRAGTTASGNSDLIVKRSPIVWMQSIPPKVFIR